MKMWHQGILIALLMALLVSQISAQASCAEVVINELHINPGAVSDSRGEWIELYNNTPSDMDLEGWILSDGKNDSFMIQGTLIIPSHGYVVLARNGDSLLNGGMEPDYVYKGMYLTNSSDTVVLYNRDYVAVDGVSYSKDGGYHIISGASLERTHPTSDPALPCSWIPSTNVYGQGDRGTPGCSNSCYVSAAEKKVSCPPYFAIMKVFSYQATQLYEAIAQRDADTIPEAAGFLKDMEDKLAAGDILRALCLMKRYVGKQPL